MIMFRTRRTFSTFVFSVIILAITGSFSFGQEIRDQKEAERVYRLSLEQSKNNRLFFNEMNRCRQLNREQKYDLAIASCKRSIVLSEKLPANQILERQSGYIQVGLAFLRKKQPKEALAYFEKGLAIGRAILDETDVETGEIYFLIGQAYHIDNDTERASVFYDRAERSIRSAFEKIGEDGEELRERYPKIISFVLKAHLILFDGSEEFEKANEIRRRILEFEAAFRKYLEN